MKRFRVEMSARAQEDLIEIHGAIHLLNPKAAERILRDIEMRIDSLVDMPERGFRRSQLDPDMRIVIEGEYLIMYRVEGGRVNIVRIVFGKRDLARLEFGE